MTTGPSEKSAIPTAADFMNRHVQTVPMDLSLAEVIQFLLKHEISNAPVIDSSRPGRHLVGFVSERDCLAFLANETFFGSPAPPQRAETMMRRHPVCVSPDTEMFALASIFVNHGYRHLPVTEEGELLGIVSRRDVLQAMDLYYRSACHSAEEQHIHRDLTQIVNHRFLVTD